MHTNKHLHPTQPARTNYDDRASLFPSSDDVRHGVRMGFGYGLGLSIIAALIFALSDGEAFERKGLSPFAVVLFYLVGGAAAGLVVGCFGRLVHRHRFARYPVGVVAAIPVAFAGTALVSHRFVGWGTPEWGTALTMSLVFGIIGARTFG